MMRPTRVLIADDSAVQRRLLATALSDQGYSVFAVKDGFEAMNWVEVNEPPDVIITDFHMPDMNGASLIHLLRSKPGYRRRPIFVLTSGGDASNKEAVREAGATAWIMKPFDIEKLMAAITKVLN